jgi:tRNA-splicing ligase RtcB
MVRAFSGKKVYYHIVQWAARIQSLYLDPVPYDFAQPDLIITIKEKKMKVINEKIPIKMWLNDIEQGALDQARHLAQLPFAFKHIAIMPDSHQGYGMPIGGVLATEGVVLPNAVGVDIGCGMCAVKTSLTVISTERLKKIMGEIRNVVPVGFKHHRKRQHENLMPLYDRSFEGIVAMEYESALKQIGTLGGGNHFIEIQQGSDGHIWIMIHSGSRNIGLKVATHYNKLAAKLNQGGKSPIPKKWDLAYFPLDCDEGRMYLAEMDYCVAFALANRKLMLDRIKKIFFEACDGGIEFDDMINIAHNYAKMEKHFGRNVMVHRKGATSARNGEVGIIPGSQGAKSYIVSGKGNPDSFHSCSHGAGRKMSRKKAQKELSVAHEINRLEKLGVLHAIRGKRDLDEAPSAYKDIDVVMENQKDLVEIKYELKPLAVIKG